jgi:hypothetical protein
LEHDPSKASNIQPITSPSITIPISNTSSRYGQLNPRLSSPQQQQQQ